MTNSACPILDLPVELRLLIYSFALLNSPAITISAAEIVGSHPDVVHRLYGTESSPHPGLPESHEPLVLPEYNASLLSTTNPATVHAETAYKVFGQQADQYYHTPGLNLKLVNQKIYHELNSHFKPSLDRTTSLFVQYPHGLHVFRTLTPHLLRQARSVHLAGLYVPREFCPARAACTGPREDDPSLRQRYHSGTAPDSATQLGDLVKALFGSEARHQIQKLELRILFPGQDGYPTVWGDDYSPIALALCNIQAGDVTIEVWRGRCATGVYLAVRPASEGRRCVSTVWRKPECGVLDGEGPVDWVVDPQWPDWEEAYDRSEGNSGCYIGPPLLQQDPTNAGTTSHAGH